MLFGVASTGTTIALPPTFTGPICCATKPNWSALFREAGVPKSCPAIVMLATRHELKAAGPARRLRSPAVARRWAGPRAQDLAHVTVEVKATADGLEQATLSPDSTQP